ncbi:hypothetical protein AgCh_029809 [Apium graveolens]
MNTTQGFEVGIYPSMFRNTVGCMITPYYCPPETTITDYELDNLTRLANEAIQHYNSENGKEYANVTVSKATRSFSCGFSYYLTFQASLPDGESPLTFETSLHEPPAFKKSSTEIDFVRLKNVD